MINDPGLDSLRLAESLAAALEDQGCSKSSWMNNIDENLCRVKRSTEEDCLYWVDKDDRNISMAFPAVLDVDGTFTHLDPYFSLADYHSVRFISLFFYNFLFTLYNFKELNLSSLKEMKATFHLRPIKETGVQYMPSEAIDCCKTAMHRLQATYSAAEVQIQQKSE